MEESIEFNFAIEGFNEDIVLLLQSALNNPLPLPTEEDTSNVSVIETVPVSQVANDTIAINVTNYDNLDEIKESILEIYSKYKTKNFNIQLDKSITLKAFHSLENLQNKHITLCVVGCGGTGSRLINLLAQQCYVHENFDLFLVDNDVVESGGNLKRQMFYEFEVGEFKSKALAERYSTLYDIKVSYNVGKVSTVSATRFSTPIIIFDCTDNKEARVGIENLAKKISSISSKVALISCGNQKDFGQVYFSQLSNLNPPYKIEAYQNLQMLRRDVFNTTSNNIINVLFNLKDILTTLSSFSTESDKYTECVLPTFLFYNKVFKDSEESTSCANMNIAEEQSMAINSTIAQIAYNMMFEYLYSEDGLKNNIVYANLSNQYNSNNISNVENYISFALQSIYGKNAVFFNQETLYAEFVNIMNFLSAVEINIKNNSSRINKSQNFTDTFANIFRRDKKVKVFNFKNSDKIFEYKGYVSTNALWEFQLHVTQDYANAISNSYYSLIDELDIKKNYFFRLIVFFAYLNSLLVYNKHIYANILVNKNKDLIPAIDYAPELSRKIEGHIHLFVNNELAEIHKLIDSFEEKNKNFNLVER